MSYSAGKGADTACRDSCDAARRCLDSDERMSLLSGDDHA